MLNTNRRRTARSGKQRGLSLVELMVGIAIGLVVVAGAALVASSQISDTRRLLLETQLQQDLRAAADITARELRRAGSNAYKNFAGITVWSPSNPLSGTVNTTLTKLEADPSTVALGESVVYSYYRSEGVAGGLPGAPPGGLPAETGGFGFRLNGGTIEYNLSGAAGAWQALTDSRVLRVTTFTVTENNGPAVPLACHKECPPSTPSCVPPTWQTRELVVDIEAEAVADPAVRRSIRTATKLRNDVLRPGSPYTLCPP